MENKVVTINGTKFAVQGRLIPWALFQGRTFGMKNVYAVETGKQVQVYGKVNGFSKVLIINK